jgi:hypothetical protein
VGKSMKSDNSSLDDPFASKNGSFQKLTICEKWSFPMVMSIESGRPRSRSNLTGSQTVLLLCLQSDSSKNIKLPTELSIASKTRTNQYSSGKLGRSIQKLCFLKFSKWGLKLGCHLFSIRTPFSKSQGEPRMHNKSLSERK